MVPGLTVPHEILIRFPLATCNLNTSNKLQLVTKRKSADPIHKPRLQLNSILLQLNRSCSLTRELEKKLSDKYVVFVGQRRVLPKESRKSNAKLGQKRPRSRTLSAVQDATLDDLVFPSEITGRRTRVAQDGSKLGKAYLDAKDQNLLEYKLDAFSSIYRALCGKEITFEFPVQASD